MKRILLVGAGHAHASLLASLRRAPLYGASLTLVSPRRRALYSGMLPGVIAGHYAREEAEYDVAALAERASAEYIEASVGALDLAACIAMLKDGRRLAFDIASLNSGSDTDRSVPGSSEHAVAVKPFDALADNVRFASRVAVVGGGAAGAELAMALRYRGGEVTLYSEGSEFASSVGERIARALRRIGVDFRPGMRVDRVEAGPAIVADGTRQLFDLVIWSTGASAQPWWRAAGLSVDERGFIHVDETLRSVSHRHVFAVGDCAAAGEAKSGVHSVRQGLGLERNLRHLVAGEPLERYEKNPRALMLLSCGSRYAVAARGGWSAEGRWVWWWKDWIDRRWMRALRGA